MTRVVSWIDAVLAPLGFRRNRMIWNRGINSLVDVVDIQVSRARDSFTINAGVLDADVYETCWGSHPPPVVEAQYCTVHARVGQLIELRDLWWPSDTERTLEDVSEKLAAHVLPFLERMHSRSEMERFLTAANRTSRHYPLPLLNLAILRHRRGDMIGACGLLGVFQRGAVDAWQKRAAEVAARLGCT